MAELNDDMVIGLVHLDGKNYVEWTPEIARCWEIGKKVYETALKAYGDCFGVAEHRIAELEHQIEVLKALQSPPPEPEIKTGTAASTKEKHDV